MKTCTHCKEVKPLAEFHARQCWCKECQRRGYRERYAADPEKYRAAARRNPKRRNELARLNYAKNREREIARNRRWYEANKGKARSQYLRAAYGITDAEYDALYQKQNGCCAICGTRTEKLQIDHDHVTGVVRGLLCGRCNRAIGLLGESRSTAERVLAYL